MKVFGIFLLVASVINIGDSRKRRDALYALKYSGRVHSYYESETMMCSELDCARQCRNNPHCNSFQFNRNNGRCVTQRVSFETMWEFESKSEPGNDVYYKVNSRDCSKYGTGVTLYPGYGISGNNYRYEYNLPSVYDCAAFCVNDNATQCLSFDYDVDDGSCQLQDVGYLDVPGEDQWSSSDTSWVLGTRDCKV